MEGQRHDRLYLVTYDLKPHWFDEYERHESVEMTKGELQKLLTNSRVIVYTAVRRTTMTE